MLHPDLRESAAAATLRDRWREAPCLRIDGLLRDSIAETLLTELRSQPFALKAQPPPAAMTYQYFEWSLTPDTDCDHFTCRFGRWWFGELREWLAQITGLELAPPPEGMLVSTLYTRGSYLSAHNDYDGARAVAYILGLTRASWPPEDGGHLELLTATETNVVVAERRTPGWNTLDIFDVRAPNRLHRVPIVTLDVERRAITGWFHSPAAD